MWAKILPHFFIYHLTSEYLSHKGKEIPHSTLDLDNVNITQSKPPFKLRTHFIFSTKSFFVVFDSVF